MDTPLTLTHAINIAGLIQATSHWLLATTGMNKPEEGMINLVKTSNGWKAN